MCLLIFVDGIPILGADLLEILEKISLTWTDLYISV